MCLFVFGEVDNERQESDRLELHKELSAAAPGRSLAAGVWFFPPRLNEAAASVSALVSTR